MAEFRRKRISSDLERRVRPRRESSEEAEDLRQSDSADATPFNDLLSDEDVTGDNSDNSDVEESDVLTDDPHSTTNISFGALAKAQDSLKRYTSSGKTGKTGVVRPLTESKNDIWEDYEAQERKDGKADRRGFSRSSKHAPTELSSKKAVSRRRDVIQVPKRESRDPRFEQLSGNLDQDRVEKNYAFLDEYKKDEMRDLRSAIKSTKDERLKEKLKRTLLSMESKAKAQMRKTKEREILEQHKKQEKELVRQGKKPFFLKKAEQNKRVLVQQYDELSGKQLDRVIERRRKKQDAREKKKMPWARRENDIKAS